MPHFFNVRIFTLYQYFLLISGCFHGNMQIETNITDWIVIEIKIKITELFKIFQNVHQRRPKSRILHPDLNNN